MKLRPEHLWAARRLGRFTVTELAAAIDVHRSTAGQLVELMRERGAVQRTGERKFHGGPGRPAPVFEYLPPTPDNRPRPKQVPPEVAVVKEARAGKAPSPVSSRRKKKGRPQADLRKLIDAWKDQMGAEPELTKGGHWHFRSVDGTLVAVAAATASDHRSIKNLRASLRQAGLDC
jgi:hypothetical protein